MHTQDVATTIMKAAEEGNNQAMIKVIAQKTMEILNKIKSVGGGGMVTQEALAQLNLPANVQRFLYSFAMAENIASDN